jgi:hypothetical protein
MARTKGAINKPIDLDRVLALWAEHHDWREVARNMLRPDGTQYTAASVYSALRRFDRLPADARIQARPLGERDIREANLGHIWAPPREQWMPYRPCYKTNTIVKSAPRVLPSKEIPWAKP